MNGFKKFWKDYWELLKVSCEFCKNHWLGLTIFSVAYTIVYLIIFFPGLIEYTYESIKSVFCKK